MRPLGELHVEVPIQEAAKRSGRRWGVFEARRRISRRVSSPDVSRTGGTPSVFVRLPSVRSNGRFQVHNRSLSCVFSANSCLFVCMARLIASSTPFQTQNGRQVTLAFFLREPICPPLTNARFQRGRRKGSRGQESGVRGQARSQKSEARGQRTEVRRGQ